MLVRGSKGGPLGRPRPRGPGPHPTPLSYYNFKSANGVRFLESISLERCCKNRFLEAISLERRGKPGFLEAISLERWCKN